MLFRFDIHMVTKGGHPIVAPMVIDTDGEESARPVYEKTVGWLDTLFTRARTEKDILRLRQLQEGEYLKVRLAPDPDPDAVSQMYIDMNEIAAYQITKLYA